MRNVLRFLTIALPLGLAVAGCANESPFQDGSSTTGASGFVQGDFGTLTYRAVDKIVAAAPEVARGSQIVVASISDTQNLEQSSALGNMMAELVRTRLVQDGCSVSEIRLRTAVNFQQNEGEFLLSRNLHAILPPQNVAGIVTGTYTASADRVYVSLKLISAADAHIVGGADFVVPSRSVAGLLPSRRP